MIFFISWIKTTEVFISSAYRSRLIKWSTFAKGFFIEGLEMIDSKLGLKFSLNIYM